MDERSNVIFSSNVEIMKTASTLKLDFAFCRKITDYYALLKLFHICDNSTNSYKYIFSPDQLKILCPNGSIYGYFPREENKDIEEKNLLKNEEYRYEYYLKNSKIYLNDLIDEFYPDYGKSIWDKSEWWQSVSLSGNMTEKFGYYEEAVYQKGTVQPTGGGSFFTTFVKNEIEKAKPDDAFRNHVPFDEAVLPDLEKDPYYYIYHRTAGIMDATTEETQKNNSALAYLHKYGLYRAFESTEQDTIIYGSVEKNIFVDAGPGTGKTYTLINKINSLVEQDVDPESIMVLCFTNAAVAEIHNRRNDFVKSGGDRGLRNVDIRTFHSFAWWLVNFYNNDEELQNRPEWKKIDISSLTYDGTIARAIHIIQQYRDYILGGWSHFIVDEIQDLTDVIAKLVLELVRGCMKVGAGITVLGDSCQAIYDYEKEDGVNPIDSKKFYELLFAEFYNNGLFCKLEVNKRQTTELIQLTKTFRESILNEKVSEMKSAVSDIYAQIPELPDVYDENKLLNLAGTGKICLLCRNNGQVLKLSSELRKRDIRHVVNAYDHKKCYATWIAVVFHGFRKAQISFDEFRRRYNQCPNIDVDAETIWSKLAYKLDKQDRLPVDEIIDAVYTAKLDDSLFHNSNNSNIIVSNIHRAKGREYEAVVIEKNFIKGLTTGIAKKDNIGEYKTLYVALTRPKKKLYYSRMVKSDGIRIISVFATGSKRWGKFLNEHINLMEIRSSDINKESFSKFSDAVQEYMWKNIKVGDEIKLQRSKITERCYDILHRNGDKYNLIGEMDDVLEDDLLALNQTNDISLLPTTIDNLYVTDVFTEISDNNEINSSERVWNWVEFCGLGKLNYDVY